MTPADFEELASTRDQQVRDIGVKIEKLVHELPRLAAEATILPITRTMISIELALTADFTYNPSTKLPNNPAATSAHTLSNF